MDLQPVATISIGAAAHMAVHRHGDDPLALQVHLSRAWVEWGILAWSFVSEGGVPVPVSPGSDGWGATIDVLLPFGRGGFEVAERADALYAEDVLRPLMARQSMRSQGGRTVGSTSPTRRSGSKRPTRRSSSSPTGTDGMLSVVPAP